MRGELKDETGNLLRFLRDLARAQRLRVLDVDGHDEVHWLAELPAELPVHTEARPGEALLGLPPIPLTPPAELSEFDGWLALRRWYRTLRAHAEIPEGRQLVLATGLLTWTAEDGTEVRDHLLLTPVRIRLDPETERVDVVLSERPTVLRDRELLEGLPGFRAARTDWLRDAVRSGQGAALRASAADILRKWCGFAFDEPVPFREDWTDDPEATGPRVRLAPALVLRSYADLSLIDYLDAMLAALTSGGAEVPPGIARFLHPGENDRLAHVPDRQAAGGLFTALLARGQRVLAVSARPHELRESLPPELAGLAVTVAGGRTDLDERLRALAQRVAAHDPERYERALAEHGARAQALEAEAARLRTLLAELRADVSYDFGPGYRGSLEELEALLRPGHRWMPVIPGLPERPPLSAAEAAELAGLLATQTPQRRARAAQLLPEPGALPGVDQVRALVSVAQIPAPDPAGDLAQRLADRDPAVIDRLEAAAGTVHRALTELGVSWDSRDWALRALRDGMAGPSPGWERLSELGARAAVADRALRMVGARWVLLPTGTEGELITTARELREHLASGGTLKRGPLRPAVQRRAEPLLTEATVDGEAPTTAELLDVVIAALEGRQAVEDLVGAWSAAGVSLTETPALDGMVAQFAGLYTRLAQVRTALRAIADTAGLLRHVGLAVPLTSPEEWITYRGALETVRIRRRASTAWAALASMRQAVELQIRRGGAPPELTAAAAALSARDLPAYERCLTALEAAREEQRVQARCTALLNRLAEAHPALATAGVIVPEEWDEAWRWAYISSYLADRPRPAAEARAEEDLARTESLAAEAKSALAAAEAWSWALRRAGAHPAPESLPLWIMPRDQVPVTVPPAPNSFDVVVLDHDNDPVEALYLLWLAPRIIILGPPSDIPSTQSLTPDSTLFGSLAARFTLLTTPPAAPTTTDPADGATPGTQSAPEFETPPPATPLSAPTHGGASPKHTPATPHPATSVPPGTPDTPSPENTPATTHPTTSTPPEAHEAPHPKPGPAITPPHTPAPASGPATTQNEPTAHGTPTPPESSPTATSTTHHKAPNTSPTEHPPAAPLAPPTPETPKTKDCQTTTTTPNTNPPPDNHAIPQQADASRSTINTGTTTPPPAHGETPTPDTPTPAIAPNPNNPETPPTTRTEPNTSGRTTTPPDNHPHNGGKPESPSPTQ
ncbi:hypothetical protein LO762_19035 [Actinocorallia sp. API 0066]|uniref:hypothetical protein n=1 Tax=Actinocorallia sp. API 0066 TaxID=2896846 RepID=UPI001E50BB20|nr:hypothetical protein [Actinocorallia sp. API 0066]MCD0451276.1 hypothetical protein [Actinocorallia sp. API 0066]